MLEILTPCRDQSHDEEHCAVHCPELNEPVWNEFLGGWFHVVQLLTPQERTARAHAQQQREEFVDQKVREAADRIRAKTRDYPRLRAHDGRLRPLRRVRHAIALGVGPRAPA